MTDLRRHWKMLHLQTHGMMIEEDNTSKFLFFLTTQLLNNFFNLSVKILNRKGPFICDKCGLKLLSRRYFHQHNLKKHRSVTLFCDLCPRSFAQKSLLAMHMRHVHLKLRSFECKFCKFRSFTKKVLQVHMLRHGSKTECKVCHKGVSNMNDHMRSHVKVNCPICYKVYSKASLLQHMKTHNKK